MAFFKINDAELLTNLGFQAFNSIQNKTFEASKTNDNLLLISPTGSGKTVAFIRCVLNTIERDKGVQVLILAPTRELVLQIESVLKNMKLKLKVNACYGGHKFGIEQNNLKQPPEILVGTPGRVLDHLTRGTFDPIAINDLIFDEFDKSLEFGFTTQMQEIVGHLVNVKRQILVSATQAINIPDYLNINDLYTVEAGETAQPQIELYQHIVPKDEKLEGLLFVLGQLKPNENAIIFVNHREAGERVGDYLNQFNGQYAVFHGGLKQERRELELIKFRNGSAQFLIATDIAARGIDVPELDYVIHYQLPLTESAFVHRNGRTGRVKASGKSILIQTDADQLPNYISEEPMLMSAGDMNMLQTTEWVTFYIGKGKKDKINKIDLVGYFLQFDFMKKTDLGLIEVKDYTAYVAISRKVSRQLLSACRKRKIKNKSVKIELAR